MKKIIFLIVSFVLLVSTLIYAKENELEVKYDYTSNAASKKNVPATVSAPAASTDEDQALLDEIAAITAMLEEDVASDRETEVSGSQDEKANVSADFETILGMKNTLENFKPKLNFSAYHRFEDIFRLAILIKEINPEYKIYLRHHPYIPAWDTNLYCI